MKKWKPFIFFGLAGVIAVLTGVLAYQWLQHAAEERRVEIREISPPTKPVVIAVEPIPWGTKITEDLIRVADYPVANVPETHFASLESLKGRITVSPIGKKEPILESKLAPVGLETGGIGAVLGKNKRAMAVRVDDVVGVAGFVKPGDRVDVLVTIKREAPAAASPIKIKGGEDAESKVVLEDIKVLAIGKEIERTGKDREPRSVGVITLEVSPYEGEKLALAASEGRIVLALRNPLNKDKIYTKGITRETLLASYRAKSLSRAKPIAPKTVAVELILGNTQQSVEFGVERR